jgi:hypothetical protein
MGGDSLYDRRSARFKELVDPMLGPCVVELQLFSSSFEGSQTLSPAIDCGFCRSRHPIDWLPLAERVKGSMLF